jgi:hypothetical protein
MKGDPRPHLSVQTAFDLCPILKLTKGHGILHRLPLTLPLIKTNDLTQEN